MTFNYVHELSYLRDGRKIDNIVETTINKKILKRHCGIQDNHLKVTAPQTNLFKGRLLTSRDLQ